MQTSTNKKTHRSYEWRHPITGDYHLRISTPPNQSDQIQPFTAPISPSAEPPQHKNLDNENASTFPSPTIFVLTPSLSPQHYYPPSVARRIGKDYLMTSTTKPYDLPNRLSPQYLLPPNEAFQKTRTAFTPPKNDTSLLQFKTQQYTYHPTNCRLSPQYLHPPNPVQTCCYRGAR